MVFKEILNDFYLDMLFEKYDENYLLSFDREKFLEIYKLFRKYNFYFIDDIVLYYLEIFNLEKEIVERKIKELNKLYGNDYVYIIGNDITKLSYFLEN